MALSAGSCRKRGGEEAAGPPPVVAAELGSNRTASLPGGVYRSQAHSQVSWQPWEKETFERARAAQRLVFAVVALPQYGGFHPVLGELQGTPAMVACINDNYVPVLVDGDAAREVGLLTADLAAEIRRPLQLPMFVWLTPDGNPVAWIPVAAGEPGKVRELFDKSHAMVSESWKNKRSYVISNSEMDNVNRRERMNRRKNLANASKEPGVDVIRAVRQLTSLYDPVSRSFDEAGGLFPTGAIEVLASVSLCRSLPDEVRSRCARTLHELMVDLVPSAMFDPLDGGLYSSRRGGVWALPVFERDCNRQALAVVALCRAYQATGDPLVLERALRLLAFLEQRYVTAEGLFALGAVPPQAPRNWLWTVEEVQQALPAEDAAWWIAATGMRGLGNLPSEADPKRDFFRCNSFGMGKSMAAIAAGLNLTPEVFKPRYDAAVKRLLAARESRLKAFPKDEEAHAVTSFRMVSAYAAAFTATGTAAYRDRAVELLKRAKEAFSDGPQLWQYASKTAPSISAGRAFLYGLTLQACLDVADVTADDAWLNWADDLATAATERFASSDFLKECPDNAKVIDLPVTDLTMLFDESSAGLISSNESRLAVRGRPLVASFSSLATPLPMSSVDRPVLNTDLLVATLVRHHAAVVVLGSAVSSELKAAVAKLPLRMVNRRVATAKDDLPAGALKILWPDGSSQVVETPESFQEAVLPSRPIR